VNRGTTRELLEKKNGAGSKKQMRREGTATAGEHTINEVPIAGHGNRLKTGKKRGKERKT